MIGLRHRFFIPAIFFLAALILLGFGYWPAPQLKITAEASPINTDPSLDQVPHPKIKQIEVVFPGFIRDGDSDTIYLKVIPPVDNVGFIRNNPTLVEVRLELPGFTIQPQGILAQPLLDKEISFQWKVRSYSSDYQGGNIWVYFVQNDTEEIVDRELLFAPGFELHVISGPVISWGWARGIGWVFLGIGILNLLWVALYNKGGY